MNSGVLVDCAHVTARWLSAIVTRPDKKPGANLYSSYVARPVTCMGSFCKIFVRGNCQGVIIIILIK